MHAAASARRTTATCSRARRGASGAGRARGRARSGCGRGEALAVAEVRARLAAELRAAREAAADAFADAVAEELRGVGMGEGEFRVELRDRDPSATGADEGRLPDPSERGPAVRPRRRDCLRGELSRVALAIAAVGGGETMVFDEIDAGVGGETARGRGDAEAPRRARPGRRSRTCRRSRASPTRTTGSRRCPAIDAHANRAARRRPAPGRARADAGRQGVHLDPAMSLIEHTGPARLGKRTKELVRRLGAPTTSR